MADKLFCNTATDRALAGERLKNLRLEKERTRMVDALDRMISGIKTDKVTDMFDYDVTHLVEYVYEIMLQRDAAEAEKFLLSVHRRSNPDAYAIHDLRNKYVTDDGDFTIETNS